MKSQKKVSRLRQLWSLLLKKQYQVALDVSILLFSFTLAYLLRFDFAVPPHEALNGFYQLPLVVALQLASLYLSGVYSFIWRYIGMAEVKAFLKAALLSALPALLFRFWLLDDLARWRVPVSVIVIDTVLAFGGVVGARVLRRLVYERYEKRPPLSGPGRPRRKPILLIGAGRAGMIAAREIQHRGGSDLEIKGFVDDDPNKVGSVIHGVKVLGSTADLPALARELEPDHVVISIAHATRKDFRRILEICERIPVKVRVVPSMYEVMQGRVQVSRIREVQIEDLMGRAAVHLDEETMGQFLAAKSVMVTGAGGSIGSELARQIQRFNPSRLLLVERAEGALFESDRSLRESAAAANPPVPLLADVGDEARMRSLFEHYRPHVIFHAAAHKHVPMMECNAAEAVKNNVLATSMLGELAGEFGAEAFVLISTDKAVRPTSVMGATKRVAELVVQNLNRRHRTRYVAVRFGNVIGSAGSVVNIFREQIRKGGPVTVTHPEMVRYFMTIPEAAQLVLQAGAIGGGGEIFVLDMGEPVRILDLAKDLITLSGLKPFEEMEISFTGQRAGEKLFEELAINEEKMSKTRHPKIFIGRIAACPEDKVSLAVERLQALCRGERESEIRCFLNDFLPEARLSGGPALPSRAAVASSALAPSTQPAGIKDGAPAPLSRPAISPA